MNANTELKPKRNIILDVYKGILIILVVIRHVLQYSVCDEGAILTNLIWAVQMPGFMMISGYFSARICNEKKDILKVVQKNSKRYLLPFFSWWMLISVFLLGKCEHNLIKGVIVLIQHVDCGLWFLWVIFFLSVLFAFCNYAITNGKSVIGRFVRIISVIAVFLGGGQ